MKKLLIYLCIALMLVSASFAATGDYVATANFATPCSSGIGVGLAFDGQTFGIAVMDQILTFTGQIP
ncbi:MAG: hypothetical protein AABX51_02980 [Nanoarchaeota archaeon]